jgi:hypothetical protein
LNDEDMNLASSSGEPVDIRYKDILSVTLIEDLDPGQFVSGIETNRFVFGVWKNNGYGEFNLCIYPVLKEILLLKLPVILMFSILRAPMPPIVFTQLLWNILKQRNLCLHFG